MKKISTIVAIALLVFSVLSTFSRQACVMSSESPRLEWSRTYGEPYEDWISSFVRTSDGGYAMAGRTYSAPVAGYMDAWLVKVGSGGNPQWTRTYGGSWDDAFYSVVQTSDGGYALAGYTGSSGAGQEDFFLVRADANGNMLWSRTYGGVDLDEARSVIQTADGGFAVAGVTRSFGEGGYDFWLVKTDGSGIMQWNGIYGGSYDDVAVSVVQTNDGGYALAGYTHSYGVNGDFWLVKTDVNGSMLWNRSYGGSGNDYGFSLVQAKDEGFAIAGWTDSFGAGNRDLWLVKTDADGYMQWNRTHGGPDADWANSLAETSDGGYVLAGATGPSTVGNLDFWLVKTDSDGNKMWNATYGNPEDDDEAYCVVQTSDGGYALAGRTYPSGNRMYANAFFVKLAPMQQYYVPAMIHIDPNVLNLKSKGQWITSYIELPKGYDVADIDLSTVLLNGTVSAELQPASIGDYDNDAIPDLMVKFNRTVVSNLILSKGIRHSNVTLTVTGNLYCGTLFRGSDVIKVKMPGDINFDGKVNLNDVLLSAKAICSHPGSPRWNPAADENEDNTIGLIDFFIVCKNYGKTYT